ncbi:MAG TPA: glycosyltransferase family 4 protein, partial [Candidatus Tyrphobacter sp.]
GIPWVFTLHGAPRLPYRVGGPFRVAYAAYLRGYGSLAIRGAAVRTTVSSPAAHFAPVARYMSDARVIPHGVDLETFAAGMPEREIQGWPAQYRRIVLSIGRIDRAKGFDVGLRALAALPSQEIAYVVLGDDLGEMQRLRRLSERLGVSERFLTLGYATLEQRRFALRRSALVWMPSRYESFGIVALEAMAAGVPVITSGVEGLSDIFAGENELLMTSPDDARDLAERTQALLADEARLIRIGERLRARAGDFDWNAIAHRYVECYRTAIDKQPHL